MRDSAKFNAKPPQERRYHTRHGFSENAKEELALIAKDFPGALHERHLPPYAIKRTGFMRYGAWRFSRVFGKSPDEVYEDIQNDAAWHGPLPDEPITPLELAVSYADRDESDLMVQTLFDFGAKATKQALDITNASRYTDLRCWTMLLLGNQPDLLSTTVYNLGVNVTTGGRFGDKYPQDVVDGWLTTDTFNQAEEARMAQATQLCTTCSTARKRRAWRSPRRSGSGKETCGAASRVSSRL